MRFALVLLTIAFLHTSAAYSESLVTDRPDLTESSSVVGEGRIQVEAGWTYSRDEADDATATAHEFPGSLVRVGLTDWLEIRLGWAGQVWSEVETEGATIDTDGLADGDAGFKVRLFGENEWIPETALISTVTIPTGDTGLTNDDTDPSFLIAMSKTITDRIGLGWNAGMSWPSEKDEDGIRTTMAYVDYSVALGMGITDRAGAFAEFFGSTSGDDDLGAMNSVDGGLTYLVSDDLQVDISGGVGITDDAVDSFIGVGLSFRLDM